MWTINDVITEDKYQHWNCKTVFIGQQINLRQMKMAFLLNVMITVIKNKVGHWQTPALHVMLATRHRNVSNCILWKLRCKQCYFPRHRLALMHSCHPYNPIVMTLFSSYQDHSRTINEPAWASARVATCLLPVMVAKHSLSCVFRHTAPLIILINLREHSHRLYEFTTTETMDRCCCFF